MLSGEERERERGERHRESDGMGLAVVQLVCIFLNLVFWDTGCVCRVWVLYAAYQSRCVYSLYYSRYPVQLQFRNASMCTEEDLWTVSPKDLAVENTHRNIHSNVSAHVCTWKCRYANTDASISTHILTSTLEQHICSSCPFLIMNCTQRPGELPCCQSGGDSVQFNMLFGMNVISTVLLECPNTIGMHQRKHEDLPLVPSLLYLSLLRCCCSLISSFSPSCLIRCLCSPLPLSLSLSISICVHLSLCLYLICVRLH